MLVVAGNLTIDDTVMPDGRTVMGAIGGDVFYTGLGAALWSRRVGLLSRVGEDFPREHLDRIQATGLDTHGLVLCAGPSIRYWVLYEWDGRRHFISRNAENRLEALSPEPDDLPRQYGQAARAFHVAALPFGHVERLVRAATRLPAAPLITLDTHEDYVAGYQEQLIQLLPSLRAFLPSREEVALWFGDDDPERHIGDLLDLGPGMVAIKMGADGSLVQQQGQPRPRRVPAVPIAAVDVTGAGDAFCGGFVARLAEGADAREAAMAGAVSASFAVEHHGIDGLLGVSSRERDERLALLRTVEHGG